MSTKTSIKRIALVAVAALGFGMVSTVSANAASGDVTSTFLGKLSTVDIDSGDAAYSATALTSTSTLATGAPGVSRTSGLASNANDGSFVALTVPAGSTVVFKITATDDTQAYAGDDTHTLIVNGQLIKTVAGAAGNVARGAVRPV